MQKVVPLEAIARGPIPAERRKPTGGGCAPSGGCGTPPAGGREIPAEIRDKIKEHPCYSEEAHHFFARIHVAVAPACNIQCNYCNRKYDCSNESRPGVVSERVTPEQALRKVQAVAAEMPHLSVVGIAGPGDALADYRNTFETFRLLRATLPDLTLCLSTNGLALPDHVEAIREAGVNHVTVTVSAIDPEIARHIYAWIYYDHQRHTGLEAARILIDRQLQGIEMLTAAGILVKVNSVMIPGINDQHLEAVNAAVKARGVFLHNVMPLISDPAARHPLRPDRPARPLARRAQGAAGPAGRRRPADEALPAVPRRRRRPDRRGQGPGLRPGQAARGSAGRSGQARRLSCHRRQGARRPAGARPLRHRRPSASLPTRRRCWWRSPRRAAAGSTSTSATPASSRSSRSRGEGIRFVGHRRVERYCSGGDGEDEVLEATIAALEGVKVVLTAKVGRCPRQRLAEAGISVIDDYAFDYVETAIASYLAARAADAEVARRA